MKFLKFLELKTILLSSFSYFSFMEVHDTYASIECEKCEIISRKIEPSGLLEHPILGKVLKYKCTRDSSSEILTELNPKIFKCLLSSNLQLGDILKAKAIEVLSKKIVPERKSVINHSSQHKAEKIILKGYSFSQITYPHENVLNSIKKRAALS